MEHSLGRLSSFLGRRRRIVAALAAVLTLVLAGGLPKLAFDTSEDGLVAADSTVGIANERYQSTFGGEPMLVLWTGPIRGLFADANGSELEALEADLRATGRFEAVIGPLTALRFAQSQLEVAPSMLLRAVDRAAAAGDDATAAELQVTISSELSRLAAAGEQTLANPAFREFLLFGADGTIRPILRDNFPDPDHALMIVRLAGNADIAELGPGSDTVKRLVDEHPLAGFTVVASGPPTLLKEINDYLQGGMASLGALAVVVMVVILFVAFRARWRLLPLAVVALGVVWAFGAMGYLGIPLTMVTISGLPILMGLGVDFAIQLQSRFEEELEAHRTTAVVVRRTVRHIGPPLAMAAVAAVAGFLALQLSKVPMIRDFGVMLVVGMVALLVATVGLLVTVLAAREHRSPTTTTARTDGAIARAVARLTRVGQPVAPLLAAVAVVVVTAGIVVDGRFAIETDPEQWVSSSSDAVDELEALRAGTQFSSELGVLVEADDVTTTEVVAWMQRWAAEQVAAYPNDLVRTTSLPAIAASVHGVVPDGEDVTAVLGVAPDDVRVSFISDDHTKANIVFPIHDISLNRREAVLDAMVADLDPPDGVTATPAGLAVVGIELVHNLQANRKMMTIVAVGGVFVWLLLARRRLSRAVLPLVPVAFAVGLSQLVLYALGVAMTPLTTVSSPLAIAVATEFSVLIQARYDEERAAGLAPRRAVEVGAVRIGRAFVASGLTLLGGFAVLAFSPLPLLSDFGIVVSVIVVTSLLSALVVMPPLLVWVDTRRHDADDGLIEIPLELLHEVPPPVRH
jgi:uncharacterized protein